MITKFGGMNISSPEPKKMVEFYEKIGVPVIERDENYDGCTLGFSENEPVIWVWDENKWGKSNKGAVCFVFNADDLTETYEELKAKGVNLEPPKQAVWGGTELYVYDPDGNTILIL